MAFSSNNTADVTRASLFLRLRADSPARDVAWAEFYRLYSPIIAGFARRMGARGTDIDDLVQDVMRSFFAASPEFEYNPTAGRFRGYLKTCVWRKIADLRTRRGRERFGAEASNVDDATVESTWNDVWETERLHLALAAVRKRYSLTREQQRTFRAFELTSVMNRATADVATELGMAVENVRQARSRISKAVREEFDALERVIG